MFPIIFSLLIFFVRLDSLHCTTFTFVNKCNAPVWPGSLTGSGLQLNPTGFELQPGQALSVPAPTGWSGRFWARTGCNFDSAGHGSCSTADCGSGHIECNGAGAVPPVTLAEFTLAGTTSANDFYDVSLVDGYNLAMIIEPGSRTCGSTGCPVDLNLKCPAELRVGNGEACKSACDAFAKPEYCCSGAHASPTTCQPSVYSQFFKSSCPRSYSYAYDDATSMFTCMGTDYTITFCPNSPSSQKASSTQDPASNDPPPKTTAGGGVMLENDNPWLTSLEAGNAPHTTMTGHDAFQRASLLAVAALACSLILLHVL